MSRSLGALWLSLSALGGLLVFLAIPGYAAVVVIPVIFSFMSYASYKRITSKRIFIALSIVNSIAGLILRWMPHSDTGGLAGLGLFICFLVFVPSAILLGKIYKSEYRYELNGMAGN